MKKIFIFLVSLFLSFGFADGYGQWHWGAVPKPQLLATCEQFVAGLVGTNDLDGLKTYIVGYLATRLGARRTVFVCFLEDKQMPTHYYMRFVFVIYPEDKTKEIHKQFEKSPMIARSYSDEEAQPAIDNDDFNKMLFLHDPQHLAINKIQDTPKKYNRVETKYRYNEDTVAIVKEGFYEGQTIVCYTYYEPDY